MSNPYINPSAYFPAILFGPREAGFYTHDGVQCIRSDVGKYYPVHLVKEAAPLYLYAPFRDTHPGGWGAHRPRQMGRVIQAWWDGRNMRGVIDVDIPGLARNIEAALNAGELVGISPYATVRWLDDLMVELMAIEAVDLTDAPYTGARILPQTKELWQRSMESMFEFGTSEQVQEAIRTMPDFARA